jgi:phage gp46-like protein
LSDIGLFLKDNCFDLELENGDLKADNGLETAVSISLFSDRRVSVEELPDLEKSRRGFWGDSYPSVDQDLTGSRLWTLARSKRTIETLRRAEDYAREALAWLIEDGVAETIEVVATFGNTTVAGDWKLDISISRPNGTESRFQVVWDAQEMRRG